MEMKKINAGKLRAIGYDARERILCVELEDGTAIDYSGVGSETWRTLSTSGAAWSYYRDNMEEFSGRRSTVKKQGNAQQLEDLLGIPAITQVVKLQSAKSRRLICFPNSVTFMFLLGNVDEMVFNSRFPS